jgi:integrase
VLHIIPFIGKVRLAEINAPAVRSFEKALQDAGRSKFIIKRAVSYLGSILADAVDVGQAQRNVVRERKRGRKGKSRKRALEVGVDIPTPQEIMSMINNSEGKWRAIIVTAAFTGLRASELRGLRWCDVDFKANEINVRQRADILNVIGRLKSDASTRTIPFGPFVANTLKEWKLACPKGELDLVFPTGTGKVERLANVINRGLKPAQGENPKYTGMHALRHFYASWCINRVQDGGLGLPPKNVQARLGHSTIALTLDRYSHLFKGEGAAEQDAAERRLLAAATAT